MDRERGAGRAHVSLDGGRHDFCRRVREGCALTTSCKRAGPSAKGSPESVKSVWLASGP
jgi:hypothetical protein